MSGAPPNLPKLSDEQRKSLLEAMTPAMRRKFLARECQRLLGRVFVPAELATETIHAEGRALPGLLKLASGRVYATRCGTRFRIDPKLNKEERRRLRRLAKVRSSDGAREARLAHNQETSGRDSHPSNQPPEDAA